MRNLQDFREIGQKMASCNILILIKIAYQEMRRRGSCIACIWPSSNRVISKAIYKITRYVCGTDEAGHYNTNITITKQGGARTRRKLKIRKKNEKKRENKDRKGMDEGRIQRRLSCFSNHRRRRRRRGRRSAARGCGRRRSSWRSWRRRSRT